MRSVRLPGVLLACLVTVAALAMPSRALAAAETLTVVSSGDGAGDGNCNTLPAQCTLREAIDDANDAQPETDTINIDLPAIGNTIVIGSQLPIIAEPTVISDVGLFGSTITSNNTAGALMVGAVSPSDVSFENLTLTAAGGPGIGAITSNNADLTITSSRITGSTTGGEGGGILLGSGTLVLQNSTVAGNETTGAGHDGGGIYGGGGTSMVITRSTVSGNRTADGLGGGIYTQGGLTLQSSTVSGNYTVGAGNGGGGIANYLGSGPTNLFNSTISGNETRGFPTEGGGVYTESTTSDPSLSNTIVSDNRIGSPAGLVPEDLAATGDTYGLAFSLIESGAGSVPFTESVPGSNLFGVDPQLGALAQNGGFGRTHLPAPTSPVVDRGSTIASQDQRLSPRPVEIPHVADAAAAGADGADIGAVELTLAEGPPVPLTFSPTSNPQANPGSRKRCKKKRGAKKRAAVAKKRRGCKKRKRRPSARRSTREETR